MVFLALKALVGHVESRGESRSHAWQPRVRSMAHGEEGLGSLLVGGRSSTEAKTRDDARGINGHEQTETFVPSQAVGPSNVCASGQPSFAPTLGIPDGHSRAVQGLVGASLRLHHLCQMQAYLLDETHSVAHQPVELRALGQGGEGIAQLGLGIAVEVPLAPKACPSGEDGEGGDLAGAQGCIWSGVMFLQSGLAEVVDYNVECGEEGVHVDHESTVPFLSGNGIGKPTLMGGHLPLNFRSSNSHQTFKDTMVMSRLARSGELKDDGKPVGHGLGAVLRTEGVASISKEVDHEWHEPLNEDRLRYAIDDVRYLPALVDALMAVVYERNQLEALELFTAAYREYLQMQYRGLPLDLDRFNTLLEKYRTRAKDALSRVEELAPEHPDGDDSTWSWGNKLKPDATDRHGNNVGRNGALRAFKLAGIKIKSLRREARTEYLRKHPEAKLLEALDEYYRYSDLHSDAKGWLTYSVADGRLYPNVNPFSQVTCRSAYSDPALQNTPKEPDEEGALSLRDCIRAADGYKIIAADYAAQELRIVAHIADDEDLVKAFTQGDPHLQIAEKIAGKKLERGTTEGEKYRKLGKSVNFGFTYGQGAARFQQSVYQKTSERILEKDAKTYQKAFQKTWRGVHAWQKNFGSRSGSKPEHWYTISFTGRRRYVSRKWDTELPGWKPSYTDRLNGPVQSGGADMLYTAMRMLREDQKAGKFEGVHILLTTHDELALEAPEDVAEAAREWLNKRMQDAAAIYLRKELAGENCVESEIGDSWGGN